MIYLNSYRIGEIRSNANEIPWGVKLSGAPELWMEKCVKGNGIIIAIFDTGCQTDHPDLKERIIGGRNFTSDYNNDPNNFSDNNFHGTHIAGTVAATLNGTGVVGMAPEAKLLIMKVLNQSGTGKYSDLIDAINYTINWRGPNNEKVRIITMSLGGTTYDPDLHNTIKRAVKNNILVVCSAGNEGDGNLETDEILYPASLKEVIQVGAIDEKKQITNFSNSNKELDIYAPGVNILSTIPNNQYASLSGTSMAAPHVAGAAAVLIEEFEQKLRKTVTVPQIFTELLKRSNKINIANNQHMNLLSLV